MIYLVLAVANWFLMIPFTIFIVATICYRMFYIDTARALETLEGVGRSPLIQHLTSTLNGLSTVRAYKSEEKFVKKFSRFQNDYSSVQLMVITSKRFFVYVLQSLQLVFVGGTLLVMVLFPEYFTGSLIGFILASVFKFTSEFQWGIQVIEISVVFVVFHCENSNLFFFFRVFQCWARLETYLCSVDRIDRIGKSLDPRYC